MKNNFHIEAIEIPCPALVCGVNGGRIDAKRTSAWWCAGGSRRSVLFLAVVSIFLLAGCGPQTPSLSPEDQIRIAVEETVAAIPTYTPYPVPTIAPKPTPISLAGIFCEYQFCIGHPADMAFFDVKARDNPTAPSTVSQGLLAAVNASLFIQVIWQNAPGATDPQFMIDLILQSNGDTRNGSVEQVSVGGIKALYVPIAPTASVASTIPYGGAAAWICGGRAFAWKAYTTQPDLAKSLLQAALQRFSCN